MGVARELSLLVFGLLVISSVCLLYANLRLFITVSFGTLNKNLISNAVSDLSMLELFCMSLLILNGFLIMFGNDFYLGWLVHDLLIRFVR